MKLLKDQKLCLLETSGVVFRATTCWRMMKRPAALSVTPAATLNNPCL